MRIFYCVKVIGINGLTEIQIYYENETGCSTNKQVLQIFPATVSHCSFIYNCFELLLLFFVCVLKKISL